ncbi:MAG: nickel pincer cofactor biosynthesis protein LarC [Cyanobacteria bacterium SZAS LIN-3]|nr:nickel pincer cofactor biosynthesis protein LarC [Cyanobacteria bacterium SZAS LIN-3]
MTIKTAYFDCAFGAAGDMLVAACIDAGVSADYIEAELRKLHLPEQSFSVVAAKVHRASLYATKFDVRIGAGEEPGSHIHDHVHDHSHDHDHDHDHEHNHDHSPEKPERALSEILSMIAASDLTEAAKNLARSIFERLGRAESAVHGVPVESIHFHEVGAVDSICDIVGFAIAYTQLGVEQAFVSPVPIGSGTVQTMHGRFPVPGPAVVALLRDAGAVTSAFALPYECLTPTGAAILCTVASAFGSPPAFARIESVGYGAGSLNPGDHPNVVRLLLGQSLPQPQQALSESGSCQAEIVAVIEANIDDLAPPVMAHAMEQILQAGALDVSLTPIVMKKGRLAQKLTVIVRPDERQKIGDLILAETTTIGTRSYFCERLTLSREFQVVTIGDGPPIRIKMARDNSGRLVNAQPEYEDCLAFARSSNLPLKQVLLRALAGAGEIINEQENA